MSDLDAWTEDDGLLHALRRKRGVRASVAQALAVLAGALLGLVLPGLALGPTLETSAVQPVLVAMAGGLVSFIALVSSLLFVVIQYGGTTFSPRLTLFRDDPLVWRSFAAFLGVFVYNATAGLRLGGLEEVAVLVPVTGIGLVLFALALARRLQVRALGLVQLNATLEEIRHRGEVVLARLYPNPLRVRPARAPLAPVTQTIRWERPGALLRQVDLPALHRAAVAADATVHLHVGVGDEIRRHGVVMTVHGGRGSLDEQELLAAIDAGIDRTFEQDPLLALRLLNDIAVRALSAAVNDPATAVAAAAQVHDLLAMVVDRDLDVGWVRDPSGAVRVCLTMPTWDDFVAAGVDELAIYGASSPPLLGRLWTLADELVALASPDRARSLLDRSDGWSRPHPRLSLTTSRSTT
jgi:uncharacterized membrane protein